VNQSTPLGFSIVIPTYNRAEIFERTLRALIAQDYPADSYEIIVVDNSTDSTPEMVEGMGAQSPCAIRLLHGPERLPAIKRNMGLRAAEKDYVLFFNDDVWADPNLLKEHASEHAAWDEPIAVLGRVDQSLEMPQSLLRDIFVPFAYFEIAGKAHQPVPYQYFWSMNLSVPKAEMIERNLIFHEDWREIGHEDVELAHRWVKADRKIIYNPLAAGEHYHPQTLDSAIRWVENIGRGLRDLEELVDDPRLLQRYAIFSWRNRPRTVVRTLIRDALWNRITVPILKRWLGDRERPFPFAGWLCYKVLIYYLNRGYRQTARRVVRPLEVLPPRTHPAASRPHDKAARRWQRPSGRSTDRESASRPLRA
jgi:glycosyltransferase involved in cell wall biosynthesis